VFWPVVSNNGGITGMIDLHLAWLICQGAPASV
jgi:hypothetical protein